MINDVASKISPVSSRSFCLRRRLGIGPSGLVRNNGWRDRCADAVGEPCPGPTAPVVLARVSATTTPQPSPLFLLFLQEIISGRGRTLAEILGRRRLGERKNSDAPGIPAIGATAGNRSSVVCDEIRISIIISQHDIVVNLIINVTPQLISSGAADKSRHQKSYHTGGEGRCPCQRWIPAVRREDESRTEFSQWVWALVFRPPIQ